MVSPGIRCSTDFIVVFQEDHKRYYKWKSWKKNLWPVHTPPTPSYPNFWTALCLPPSKLDAKISSESHLAVMVAYHSTLLFPRSCVCDRTSSLLSEWLVWVCAASRIPRVWSGSRVSFSPLIEWLITRSENSFFWKVAGSYRQRDIWLLSDLPFEKWIGHQNVSKPWSAWNLFWEVWRCPLSLMRWQVCEENGTYTQN